MQALRLAGVEVDYQVEIDLPPTKTLFGREYRIWTDPKFSELIVACPDVLEASLRALARAGIGEDCTSNYSRRAP